MAFAAILGSALGGAAGDMSSGMASAAQYQASKHERNIAWKRMQQWELIAPTLRMQGLKAAGLNPILAATQGFTKGGTQVPEASPGGTPSFSRDMGSRIVQSARMARLMDAEVGKAEAERLISEREADAARFLPEKAYHAAGAEGERWSQLAESVMLMRAQADASSAQAERTRVGTTLDQAQVPSARALEDLYSKYPWLRQVGAVLKDVRR